MRKKILILGVLAFFVSMGCAKVDEQDQKNVGTLTLPIASFYYTGHENPAPVTVTFHNTSQYSDQFLWTFHNGATSTEHSPTFNYPNVGEDKSYMVTLKVTDSGSGETDTRSKSILIKSSK
jgi:PKD repeat protein